MGGWGPYDRPSTYILLFVGLLAGAIAYPDGFQIVSAAATGLVLVIWVVLLFLRRERHDRRP